MNIYQKVQKMRVDLQNMNVKKSGENKFAGYKYYELGDILPPINQLMLENGVASILTFAEDYATLTLINSEKPDERIQFTSPMAGATLKGAHDIQNLGAVETYQRRYLYMTAFEVVESDFFDATQGKDQKPGKPNKGGKPSAGKRQKNKLSPAMSTKLNEAISAYSDMSGESSKAILERITTKTGKIPAEMTDADGTEVLKLINTWADEAIEEMGEAY